MNSPWLIVNGTSYSLSDIRHGNFKETQSIVESSVLRFCKDWLTGKQEFSLSTSGSTGTPKNILVTRKQLQASAQLTISYLGLTKEYTALVCLDTRYIAGVMMLVRAMEAGMNMYVVEPAANPLEKIPNNVTLDFAALVPYQLETILRSDHKNRLNSLKIAIIGGAALSDKTRNAVAEFKCSFYSTYGMTETLSHIALQRVNGADAQTCFQVLPGISVNKDERGCLIIDAPHLSAEPIITNDLVDMVASDQFSWLGRIDTIINSGGIKVIPEKIESRIEPILSGLGLPNRFFIAGLPDSSLGQAVTLIVEGENLSSNQELSLRQQLKNNLGRYEVPRSIRYVTRFIQTDTGKINKSKTLDLIR
jgi:o-succinylbenzoate---CoA ligase